MTRKTRDGEFTKDTVLAAAKDLFAKHGFSATSLKMISERCDISDGLILHHFQNKQALYHAVLEQLAGEYQQMLFSTMTQTSDPLQVSEQTLRAAFQFWSEDSHYNRLSMWAYLEDQNQLVDGEMKLTAKLIEAIQQIQSLQLTNPVIHPFALLPMIIGPIHFWVRYREQFQSALSLQGSLEELNSVFLEDYLKIIQTLLYSTQQRPAENINKDNI